MFDPNAFDETFFDTSDAQAALKRARRLRRKRVDYGMIRGG